MAPTDGSVTKPERRWDYRCDTLGKTVQTMLAVNTLKPTVAIWVQL